MTWGQLIRSAIFAWDRWRWNRSKRAPRSILRMQEELQSERRRHGRPGKTLAKIKAERTALLKMELGR